MSKKRLKDDNLTCGDCRYFMRSLFGSICNRYPTGVDKKSFYAACGEFRK